jgi:hypothetical protein
MRDTFSTLDATTGARSLTTLGKSIVGVGAVVGIAAIAYAGYSAKKGAAEARTETFTQALLAEKRGQEGATAALIANNIASESAFDISSNLGISQAQLAAAIQGKGVSALDDLRESFDAAFASGASWDQANITLQKQYGVSAQAISVFLQRLDEQSGAMATALTDTQKQIDAERAVAAEQKYGTDITDRKANATYEAAAAVGELTGATEEGTDADDEANEAREEAERLTKAVTTALDERRKAEQDLRNEMLSAIDKNYAYRVSLDDAEEALAEYNEAVDGGKLSTEEMAAATLKTGRQLYETAADYAASEGAVENSQAAIDLMIESLYTQMSTLDPNSPLRLELLAYIEDLGRIPTDIETKMTVRRIGDVGFMKNARGTPPGGSPGGLTLVGEEGPELVNMPKGAVVTPAGETARLLGGAGSVSGMASGSGAITVNIYPKALPTDRELIDLVNSVRRRNGNVI